MLAANNVLVLQNSQNKKYGLSVRCLKDYATGTGAGIAPAATGSGDGKAIFSVVDQPASTIAIPLSADKCYVLGSKEVDDHGKTQILITDFLGHKVGEVPKYFDALLNV
jgi:hypothetical protein